jgi:D-aminopeptidase
MKIYIMTDLEGVAGVLNFQEWTSPGKPYYPVARELLTLEVNAAVDGFFKGGATEILVSDAHGPGAIDVKLLDARVDLLRGWGEGPWPLCLDKSFHALAFVGQHAKAGTPYAHLCHTQSLAYIDLSINGISIGEFGQLAMCASELGVRTIFGSGDLAFTKEAQALVPGIETAAVKRGMKPGAGEDLTEEEYARATASCLHTHPVRVRALIRAGALRAMERARAEDFGIIPLRSPFERVIKLRPNADRPQRMISRVTHPTSVIAAMNLPDTWEPLES